MGALVAVNTMLLHAPSMLTVRELLRLTGCCQEWHRVVATQLAAHTQAVLPMYRFLLAWPRSPPMTVKDRFTQPDWSFAESDWRPFVSAVGTSALTPRQWALYYTFCFWLATDELSPYWMSRPERHDDITHHVTMRLFPSGLVAQLSTKHQNPPPPPYIRYDEKNYSRQHIRLNLHSSVDTLEVDLYALGGAVGLRQAFNFDFVVDELPLKFTLFEMTDDVKSFTAYRLANWDIKKPVHCGCSQCVLDDA